MNWPVVCYTRFERYGKKRWKRWHSEKIIDTDILSGYNHAYTERSHSGLVRPPAKWVGWKQPREFKSRPLRPVGE